MGGVGGGGSGHNSEWNAGTMHPVQDKKRGVWCFAQLPLLVVASHSGYL